MAEKVEKKENRILSIFTKEYKYEGLILLLLAIIAILLGVMVLLGISSEGTEGLIINERFFISNSAKAPITTKLLEHKKTWPTKGNNILCALPKMVMWKLFNSA